MNMAHAHLLLNHFPVIGTAFAFVLLLVAVLGKNAILRNAGLTAFVVIALITLPVYFTGEPAEKVVKEMPGVTEAAIEQHEDAALVSLIAVEVLGILAAASIVLLDRSPATARRLVGVCLALSIVAGGSLAYTANAGGQIRHTEIRSGAGSAVTAPDRD